MYNFNEKEEIQKFKEALDVIPDTEKIVDQICEKGYQNLFFIGIGGTVLYANQMAQIVKQEGSRLPLYVENAADFNVIGNPHFSKDSIIVIESVSGDTKEVVEAVDRVREAGAKVIGYVETEGSPLYKKTDYLITGKNAGYFFWYTITLRFMKNAGEFPQYDQFMKEVGKLPENLIKVQMAADPKAKAFAVNYQNEPITYIISSGNLEDWGTCYGMCIMEEMQWMRTRPISAANFFHGTLEVVEKDTCVLLMKGEDKTRPLMDRAERFLERICEKITVFDTADYELEGISKEFRGLLSPLVMNAACRRISANLERERRHPLDIRRYYRRLNY